MTDGHDRGRHRAGPDVDAQASYLRTLSDEAHQPFDPELTKAEASKRIDELQSVTGRGRTHREPDR